MGYNLGTRLLATVLLAPALRAAGTVNATGIDAFSGGNHFDAATAVINIGALAGTPSSFSVVAKLQESANNSDWTDVDGVTATYTAESAVHKLDYSPSGLKRYRRINFVVAFVSGTSPTVAISAVELAGDAKREPV